MEEQVFDCVIPYIQTQDLNSVSLVSRKYFHIDSLTRKHLTVHVHFAPDPERISRRFPNLESLTLKSYSHGYDTSDSCCVPVTPWIEHMAVEFKRLKSLSIRNMVVSVSDLQLLAKTRGGDLRSLEIRGCKMFSEGGLEDIARYCIDLRSLSLDWNTIDDFRSNGKWLHELALSNSVMESLYFHTPFDRYDMKDVERLANKCSNSLVSLNVFPRYLSDFEKVLKHAKKLDHFGYGIIDEDCDYSGFEIPSNIHALRIQELGKASFPFILPYLNQLRELVLECADMEHNCQCLLFESCPNLEVLATEDICGDSGCRVIGKFCKKLRKLTHHGFVSHMGLIALAQGCHNLNYLKVNLKGVSNEALECVGTRLKDLTDLRMWLGKKDGIKDSPLDKGVRDMLIGCTKLERLDFKVSLGGLTDVGLGYIGKYGHNLRHLSLSYTGESDAGLLKLSKGCPKLRKLKLKGCPFSKKAVATFPFNIFSLRYVWVESGVLTRPMVSTESKLKSIDSDLVENLAHAVGKRVEVLRAIQSEHDELEEKFSEERAALEAKYQKLYAPLYSKRYDIVTGAVEVNGAKAMDQTEKGVPEFWLTAMKHNEITAEEITERDEEALKYLNDIKWCRMDDPKGFKLEFFFNTNPFFTNSVLTKIYHMIDDDEPMLEKAIGTTIEWLPGKCLTQKILKIEDCQSFFNFFSPPEVPPDDAEDIEDDMAEELRNQMEQDYDIGSTIRDKIIPHAVSWFTGEANQEDFGGFDDDEIDEDDEDEEETKTKKSSGSKKSGNTVAGGEAERPPECKQQQ